ncbi:MAG: hypothetical protein ACK5ZV_05485 [bacterium]
MNSVRVAAMVLAVAGGMGLGSGLSGPGVALGQGAAAPAAGAPGGVVKMPDNAAVVYYRYWSMLSREQTEAIRELGGELTVPDAAGREQLSKLLGEIQTASVGLARATTIRDAEWNFEFDQGLNALLPELGQLRNTARLFVARARLALADGRADDAAKEIAQIFPLARHTAASPILISSLVSAAINSLGCASVEALLRDGRLTEAGRAVLLEAMQSHMGGADPFKMAAAIQAERWLIAQWAEKELASRNAADRLKLITDLGGGNAAAAQLLANANVQQAAKQADEYYAAVAAAWSRADADAELAKLEEKVKAGGFGPLAQVMGAAFVNAKRGENRAREAMAKAVAALKAPPDRSGAKPPQEPAEKK